MREFRDLFLPFAHVDALYSPGYLDTNSAEREIRIYPRFVALAASGAYLVFSLDAATGQLLAQRRTEIELPSELVSEPTILAGLVNLTSIFLDVDRENEMIKVSLYGDEDSDLHRSRFRAVAFTFDDGRLLLLDPFWASGIRVGGAWDKAYLEKNSKISRLLEVVLS